MSSKKLRDTIIATMTGILGITLPAVLVTHFVGAASASVVLVGSIMSFVVGVAGGVWLALTETELLRNYGYGVAEPLSQISQYNCSEHYE